MKYFLGIDLGTSYFKAGVFDEKGRLCGLGRHVVKKNFGEASSSELSVDIFWETLRQCVNDALRSSNLLPNAISTLSYSSQANSFILLDEEDNPLTNIILWSDTRVNELPVSLQSLTNRNDFTTKTGLGIFPGKHSAIAKIDWIQKNQPDIWRKVKRILSISDYLTFSLTGHFVSDMSTSSMTGLLNVTDGKWWEDAINLLQLDSAQLAEPIQTGVLVGNLVGQGAARIGLTKQTRLITGGLDHHMVAIGSGEIHSSAISESTGTVLAAVNCKKGYTPREGINIAQSIDPDHYFQMAFNNNGALALEWYQKEHAPKWKIPELLELATKIAPTCNGLIAQPNAHTYEGLDGFVNMTEAHTNAHCVRAILESTGASLLELVEALEGEQTTKRIASSGGGAKSRLWLQIKADILNKSFLVPETSELACKGAAMLSAVGSGYFTNLGEAMDKQEKSKEIIYPDLKRVGIYHEWYNKIKHIRYASFDKSENHQQGKRLSPH